MFSCFKDGKFMFRFIKITLPVMLAGFLSFVVSFLDNIMVGTVSNEVVSGVYAANEVTYIINILVFGILEGAGIFIEQYNGTKDHNHIRQIFRYKWIVAIIYLAIVIPLVYLLGPKIIYLFCNKDSNSDVILLEGTKYLNIVTIGTIPYMIGYIYSSSLKETGKTMYTMMSAMLAVVTNAFLNYFFIIKMQMGGPGAAIATVISRVVEAVFIITISYFRKFEFCKGAFKDFYIEKDLAKAITRKSALLFLNEVGFGFGVVLQSMAFSQRDGVLSAISIVSTISNIIGILFNALSVGIGVMVGTDLGSDQFEKAKDENKKLNFLGVYMSLTIGIIFILTSAFIPNLFKEVDASQKLLATKLIIIYGSILPATCLALTAYVTLRLGGKTLLTFLLDTGTMFLLYVPLSWILAVVTNLDMLYIYLIIRLIDVLKAIIGIIMVSTNTWVVNITIKDKEVCNG